MEQRPQQPLRPRSPAAPRTQRYERRGGNLPTRHRGWQEPVRDLQCVRGRRARAWVTARVVHWPGCPGSRLRRRGQLGATPGARPLDHAGPGRSSRHITFAEQGAHPAAPCRAADDQGPTAGSTRRRRIGERDRKRRSKRERHLGHQRAGWGARAEATEPADIARART